MSKKIVFIVILMLLASYIKAQKTETIKIESGEVYKKYKGNKLDSLVVSVMAENYGNHLVFTKTDTEVVARSINDENSLLKFGLKNGKQFKTFFYKKHPILSIETIDFDRSNLPKNAFVTGSYDKNTFFYNVLVMDYEKLGNDNPDKIFKLFHRLNIDPTLNSLDSIFDYIAKFFSQEDALLKIYKGSYAEKFEPQATAWLKTDDQGKIDRGIIWISVTNTTDNGKYEVYKSGKIINSGTESLEKFRKTFETFISTLGER